LRLADRITALAGSVDVSGFAPFFSPSWPTLTLIVSLVAILLMALVIFVWRRDPISLVGIA
jgi:hypothetical protein